jgi:hypothetical protein
MDTMGYDRRADTMSALVMILTAALAVPGDGAEKVSAEMMVEQGLKTWGKRDLGSDNGHFRGPPPPPGFGKKSKNPRKPASHCTRKSRKVQLAC